MSKHTEIYHEVQNIYKGIKAYEQRLEAIRANECKHPVTEMGNYMWAPGHISSGMICQICGELLPAESKHIKGDKIVVKGSEYWLDLMGGAPVHVKVLEFLANDEVLVEYLNSTPGRTETLPLQLF